MTTANQTPEMLDASRLIGMDVIFDRLVEILVKSRKKHPDQETLIRGRLGEFYPHFQRMYATHFAHHMGSEAGPRVLAAFRNEGVQRYVAARQAMTPKFERALKELRTRMGETEI
ncbi:MAG: hypothetical protein RL033_5790 [Pseudomonadota bacterium]|jgi:hypothetical protein